MFDFLMWVRMFFRRLYWMNGSRFFFWGRKRYSIFTLQLGGNWKVLSGDNFPFPLAAIEFQPSSFSHHFVNFGSWQTSKVDAFSNTLLRQMDILFQPFPFFNCRKFPEKIFFQDLFLFFSNGRKSHLNLDEYLKKTARKMTKIALSF